MYYTVFPLFAGLSVLLALQPVLNLQWPWFSSLVYNYALVAEFCSVSAMFVVYLFWLNQKLNTIANEAFASEKKTVLIMTTTFLVVYLLYTVLTLVHVCVDYSWHESSLISASLLELGETLLFELAPLLVIQVQHLLTHPSIRKSEGSANFTD